MSLREYWAITPKEYEMRLEAHKQKQVEADSMNWLLGKYIAYAVNEPKKYPKQPFMSKSTGSAGGISSLIESGARGEELSRGLQQFIEQNKNG